MGLKFKKAALLTLHDLKHVGLEVADECYELLGEAWHIAHFMLELLWELLEYILETVPELVSKEH